MESPSTFAETKDHPGSLLSVGWIENSSGSPSGSWKCEESPAAELMLPPSTTLMSAREPVKVGGRLADVAFRL